MLLIEVKKQLAELAPKIVDALQDPAPKEKLDKLAEIIGMSLPADFLRLYEAHNGTDPNQFVNFFYGYIFLDIDNCIRQVEDYSAFKHVNQLVNADRGIKTDYTFNKLRIPIGDDRGTCLICVDLDPDVGGTLGQVIFLDYDSSIALLLADSIESFIEIFAKDLAEGKYSLNRDAAEDGECWLEPDTDIDLINWHKSQRWAYAKSWI